MEIKVGDKVQGEYYGKPFEGVVSLIEPDWSEGSYRKSRGGFHVFVKLTSEIEPGCSILFLGSVLAPRNFRLEVTT